MVGGSAESETFFSQSQFQEDLYHAVITRNVVYTIDDGKTQLDSMLPLTFFLSVVRNWASSLLSSSLQVCLAGPFLLPFASLLSSHQSQRIGPQSTVAVENDLDVFWIRQILHQRKGTISSVFSEGILMLSSSARPISYLPILWFGFISMKNALLCSSSSKHFLSDYRVG